MRTRLAALLKPSALDSGLVAAAPPVAAREIARRFWPFARPYRKQLLCGLVLILLVPAIDTAEIWLFKLVVDDVLVPKDVAALFPLAAAYVGLAILGAVISFGDEYLATWVGERFLLDLREKLYAHVHQLTPDQLGERRTGDLMSRLTSDVQAIERFLLGALGEGIGAVARIIFFTGALFVLSWRLALAAFVVVPLFYVAARTFSRLVRHASREKRRRSGSLSAVAEEGLNAAPLVQSLNRQDAEVRRFRRENEAIMDAELAATRVRGLFAPIVDLIELIGALIVIGLGVWALSAGDLTLGGLLVFLTFLAQLYSPVRALGQLSNDLFSAAAGAERVLELLDEQPAVVDAPHARTLSDPVRGHLRLRGVTHRHPRADRPALDRVDLVVRPGELVALTGPSGAGKSTLARLLMRFADPTEGSVELDGHDLRDLRLAGLRDHVGLLLQDTLLPDDTARVAIAQGREGVSDEQIEAAAQAAGIHDVLASLPQGYDTPLGPGGRRLSGGQRRRLAIARAFVRDTPVLVLDEPTTGLDEAARDRLLGPLRTLVAGRTAVVITHDPAVMAWADRVIELRDGVVVSDRRAGVPA